MATYRPAGPGRRRSEGASRARPWIRGRLSISALAGPQSDDGSRQKASGRDAMMDKPLYRVAAAGLDPRDARLIEIVFRHSQYNRYAFQFVPADSFESIDIL